MKIENDKTKFIYYNALGNKAGYQRSPRPIFQMAENREVNTSFLAQNFLINEIRYNDFRLRCKMVTVHVSSDYTVKIPSKFRSRLRAGQEVAISVDTNGRLIITPIEQIHALLQETFGIWADQKDIPADGVEYMDKIRCGRRLDDMGLRKK
jgi:bifunctional DNA-binding transcriptional regulator/antitoxin component of YhaV-PrlF toxin-antitoxin module